MKQLVKLLIILLTTLLVLLALGASVARISDLGAVSKTPGAYIPGSVGMHYAQHPALMYIHAISGILFLVAGSYQLIPYFRNNFINVHRMVGRVFLLNSMVVSFSALILGAFYPFGNYLESCTTLVFGGFLLYATVQAYVAIRLKMIIQHSNWVRRIFFIGLSISTIRIIMGVNMAVTGETLSEVMGRAFPIAFILHTLLTELWIRTYGRQLPKLPRGIQASI